MLPLSGSQVAALAAPRPRRRRASTVSAVHMSARATIHLFCEAAGTDPRAGDGDFDITATDRAPHFGFGGGIHYCLGHLVARADMCTALTVLARRLRGLHAASAATWLPDSGNTGPIRLPLAFTPEREPT